MKAPLLPLASVHRLPADYREIRVRFMDCEITRDADGEWIAESLELPGCASRGRTPMDAAVSILEAVAALKGARRGGPPRTRPTTDPGMLHPAHQADLRIAVAS